MKTMSSDKAMRGVVELELQWDPRVDATHIGVTATDGAVTLTGRVPAYSDKVAAVRAAERVYGVRAVADEMEVDLPKSAMRDDSEIAEEIAHERRWNTAIPSGVDAEVRNGNVTLRGQVEWRFQRQDAERAVRHLAGVRGVVNAIMVKPPGEPSPEEVVRRAEDAIERMADLDGRSIWVTTGDGVVHLHGHVHSMSERRIAEHAAESAPGVTDVVNELAVVP